MVAAALAGLPVPAVAVLGDHDHHAGQADQVRRVVEDAGVTVLEGEAVVIPLEGAPLGVAGAKGFGGGFARACPADFGEDDMKRFVRHTKETAGRLGEALGGLHDDVRVALLHDSPVDRAGAGLVLHGHAHAGAHQGMTPGGIPVHNVAQPVIGRAYRVFALPPAAAGADADGRETAGVPA